MEPIIEITDKFGRKRRARKGEVPADGETIHFPATLMDAMSRVLSDPVQSNRGIHDAYGSPAGHRPGYCFGGNRQARAAAEVAYEQRRQRLQDAWRTSNRRTRRTTLCRC